MTGLSATGLSRPHLPGPVDIDLQPGTVTALCGPNGAGKTTLLRALVGLSEGSGTVTLGEKPLAEWPSADRARRLTWLPADRRAEWPLIGRDVIALGLQHRDQDAVSRALERTSTTSFAERRIDTLSTGERARLFLARAIVASPDVLVLDEPTANLDPEHQLDVMSLLRTEAKRGAAVLLSLHDILLARQHADNAILLKDGLVAATGPAANALSDTNIEAVFHVRPSGGTWVRA